MNYENNTQHEFRARLPWIDKIPSNVLEGRVDLGVRRTLDIVTAFASQAGNLASLADDPTAYMQAHRENTRQIISSCNFSTSQCVKEMKKRGVKIKL